MSNAFETCCGITDEQCNELARAELAKLSPIRANTGRALLYFLPFRKDGVIEIAWDMGQGNSVEAVVVDDNTGYQLPKGTKVMSHPEKGNYFQHCGVRLCVVEADDLLLVEEA